MENLMNYLHDVIDENITLKPFSAEERLPFFLRELYQFKSVEVSGKTCVLLFLIAGMIEPSKIQKHFTALSKYTNAHPVLVLSKIRSPQRKRLLENRIAFIVPGTQLYLPFVSLDFREQYPSAIEGNAMFTAITQAVYVFLFYRGRQFWGVLDIAKKINVTAMSVSRALRCLETAGVVKKFGATTRVKYQRIDKEDYYSKAERYLSTPVSKVVYVEEKNLPPINFLAGEEALAGKTMLSHPARKTFAVDKISFRSIPKENIMQECGEEDHCVRLEVWKYDPGLFATNGFVDELSLLLSFKETQDERIGIEIERLLGELLCED